MLHKTFRTFIAAGVASVGMTAAASAADYERLVGQFRIVAFFDRSVEGVAIDMRDGQVIEFLVADDPRTAAFPAPP